MDFEKVVAIAAVVLGPGGALAVTWKLGLNGTRDAVRRIEKRLDDHLPVIHSEIKSLGQRVSRIEGGLGL